MSWITGPVYQSASDTEWWIGGFNREPGGVVVGAESFTDSAIVTTLYHGNQQPNYATAQIHGNPYKSYFIGVRGGGSFWIIGVGS